MKRTVRIATVLAALAALTGTVAAKVESRCLPPEMPIVLFPTWVSLLPEVGCQEISAPLAHERAASRSGAAKAVRSLSKIPKESRAAIELAQSGQYTQAATAGNALLKLPGRTYGDFTWDYLANATAWSHIQAGSLKGAEGAHRAAVARIADTAVVQYHRVAADVLRDTKKSAQQLKDYATYQDEMREGLVDRVKTFEENAQLARKVRSAEARLRRLKAAYTELRVLVAADPDIGNASAKATFRKGADGLAGDVIPVLLGEARRASDRLVALYPQMLPEHKFRQWNTEIRTLWNSVRHVKRLCRMHDYLARLKLATRGESERLFRQAHQLLFVPDNARMVWQEIGHACLLNGIAHRDLRRKVPYQETPIAPIGVTPGGATVTAGWKKMDGDNFEKMDGKMEGGQFEKMDGKMQKGQFEKMDGKMQKGQFKKMGGKMGPMQ